MRRLRGVRVRILLILGIVVVPALLGGCGGSGGQRQAAAEPVPLGTPAGPAGAGTPAPAARPATPSASPSPSPSAAPSPSAPPCPHLADGFDCDFQRRFAAVQAYLQSRPGTVGIVVRDRVSGAVWRNSHAGELVWTASTIKLAMTVDLLTRDRAGQITLTAADRGLIHNMLNWSDNDAADTLWSTYGRDGYATRFPTYGLTSVTFVPGFSRYWGYMKCTADDLDRLMRYVLTKLPPDLRSYVVNEMQHVAANQQWGVWGAGPAAAPGNKDGWSQEQGGYVINSVGFVGPGQRYTLAMMNNLRGQGGHDDGVATVNQIAKQIFQGRF